MAFSIAPLSFTRRTFIAGTGIALTGRQGFAEEKPVETVASEDRPFVHLLTTSPDATNPIAQALHAIAATEGAAPSLHHALDLPEAEQALSSLAEGGERLIVVDMPMLAGIAERLSASHPRSAFLVNVASADEDPRFAFHARGRTYRAAYLQGSLSARRSASGRIGLLGCFAVPETLNLFRAFCEGANSVSRATAFPVAFSNSFDPVGVAGASAFRSLVDRGADVVLSPADLSATPDHTGVRVVRYADPLLLSRAKDDHPGALWQIEPMLRRIIGLTAARRSMA